MNFQSIQITRKLIAAVTATVLLISALFSSMPLFLEGVQASADTNNFLKCATAMLGQSGIEKAIASNVVSPWCRSYTGFLMILTPIIYLSGDHWSLTLTSFNILFHAIAITLCSSLTYQFTKEIWWALATAALLILSVDILIRVHWPLADSFFFMMATISFFGVALTVLRPESRKLAIGAIFAVVLAGLSKPHGLIVLSIGLPAILLRARLANLGVRTALIIFGLTVFLIFASFLFISWIITPDYQPISFEVAIMKEFLMTGQVIEGVYSTYNSDTDRFFGRFFTMCERFFTFFSFFPIHWSQRHIALSSLFFIPSYFGLFFCWTALATKSLRPKFNGLILLITTWILGFATFAGWFDVSYEFRYRLPIMGLFAIGGTLGFYLLRPKTIPND